jgi:hypothetical protein
VEVALGVAAIPTLLTFMLLVVRSPCESNMEVSFPVLTMLLSLSTMTVVVGGSSPSPAHKSFYAMT